MDRGYLNVESQSVLKIKELFCEIGLGYICKHSMGLSTPIFTLRRCKSWSVVFPNHGPHFSQTHVLEKSSLNVF